MSPAPVVFLPGILMPAPLRYAALIEAVGPDVRALTKELEVYRGPTPPDGYTLETELDGIDRFADAQGLERFHLYGHSGGGAVSLAYVARDPSRVISLALDEPATDYSAESFRAIRDDFVAMSKQGDGEFIADFGRSMMKSGAEPPPRPPGPPPDWMANRPAGVRAFVRALAEATVDLERFRDFTRPVYYSFGSLSNTTWAEMPLRLEKLFGDFHAEEYEGASHPFTSHIKEPARVAGVLKEMWGRAEG